MEMSVSISTCFNTTNAKAFSFSSSSDALARTKKKTSGGRRRVAFGIRASLHANVDRAGEWVRATHKGVAALALAAALQLCPAAYANEFDILNGAPPTETYLIDDAGVVNRVTKSDLKRLLSDLESRKGYHINCVTLRKLTSKADAFEFADQVLEKWYPSVEEGNNKGVVLLVTSQKEGAVTGGPAFIQAVGDQILEGVVSENLPDSTFRSFYTMLIV